MRLRRGSGARKAGRQRLRHQDAPPQRSFSYSTRQAAEPAINLGRQMNRETLKPAARKLWRLSLQRFGLIILLAAVVLSVGNALSLSTDAQVLPLDSKEKSSFLHSQATYQAAAQKLLASSIWNRNKITVNSGQITRELQKQFPEIASASMTLPLVAHRPIIYIQPVEPAVALKASNGTFVLGDNGKALLAITDQFATTHSLPAVTDQSGLTVQLDHQALTETDVSFIKMVIAQLNDKKYIVTSMTLPAASRELDVSLEGKPYQVKFNLQSGDARQQAGTFLATAADLESKNITPVQYVDVRVDGRAYYK